MTIGPAPMRRMDSMSSRRGTSAAPGGVDERGELVEQVGGVVRAGARLRVVLHAEGPHGVGPDALDHPVVEVDVADRDVAAAADRALAHRVVVVLAGDLDLAGREAAHGVV